VTFEGLDDDRTRVRLEHRGWDRIGERGPAGRAGYERGWDTVLGGYVERIGRD
jgi:hypothetical protein